MDQTMLFITCFKKYDNEIRIINVDKLTYAGNLGEPERYRRQRELHICKADICDADAINKIFEEKTRLTELYILQRKVMIEALRTGCICKDKCTGISDAQCGKSSMGAS